MSDSGDSSDSEVYIPRDPVVPLPVTGPRERKKVERFAVPVVEKAEKKLVIPEGKGTKLGSIATVNANLDKLKSSDETVKGLHRLLFGRVAPSKSPKNDLKAFNGFEHLSEKEEEALEEKLGKWTVGGLRELIDVFNLEAGGDKDALLERLMVFLKKPEDSGLVPRAQKAAQDAKEKKAQALAVKKAKAAAKAKKSAELKAKKTEQKKAQAAKKKAALAKAKAAAKASKASKTSTSTSTRAPKVRSAFDMYVKDHQKAIKDATPDASRADIYKKLVDKWEAVDTVVREDYEAKAVAENAKSAEKRAKAAQEAKKEKKAPKAAAAADAKKPKKEKAAKTDKATKVTKEKKEKATKDTKEKKEKAAKVEKENKEEAKPKKAAKPAAPKADAPKEKKEKAPKAAAAAEKKPDAAAGKKRKADTARSKH
ncbi:hypothetical protein BKA57DRAFT_307996 [Linnemannia elongata]|nr:hypothetical protein BKA57DRAFT_307996 [Linnemannia elongata]